MNKFKFSAALLVLASLAGCDTSSEDVFGFENQPDVYLSKGMKVQISESEIARVYGDDKCPDTMTLNYHDDAKGSERGCIKLTNNEKVNVTIVTSDGQFREVWSVKSGEGLAGNGFSVHRPNGWLVHEPSKEG